MFLPVNNAMPKSLAPANCSFAAADWEILASFWHPVAFSSDVTNAPVGITLLDVNVVLFRTPDGVRAAKDLCMHRGARLSLGSIKDGLLVCGFHGFHYNCDGVCVKIPALAERSPIPVKLRLHTYRCEERYGLVWICLAPEPRTGLPEWPDIEKDQVTVVPLPMGVWQASAARHVENFNDICHLPWIHANSIGGRASAIEPYNVSVTDDRLSFEVQLEEQVRYVEKDSLESGPHYRESHYTYELTLPFASSVCVRDPQGVVTRIYDIASPVSATSCRIFQCMVDESNSTPVEQLAAYSIQVNSEDIPQVEAQSPHELPLDLRDEIHIPADRMSLEYRRALARLGLGADGCM